MSRFCIGASPASTGEEERDDAGETTAGEGAKVVIVGDPARLFFGARLYLRDGVVLSVGEARPPVGGERFRRCGMLPLRRGGDDGGVRDSGVEVFMVGVAVCASWLRESDFDIFVV